MSNSHLVSRFKLFFILQVRLKTFKIEVFSGSYSCVFLKIHMRIVLWFCAIITTHEAIIYLMLFCWRRSNFVLCYLDKQFSPWSSHWDLFVTSRGLWSCNPERKKAASECSLMGPILHSCKKKKTEDGRDDFYRGGQCPCLRFTCLHNSVIDLFTFLS